MFLRLQTGPTAQRRTTFANALPPRPEAGAPVRRPVPRWPPRASPAASAVAAPGGDSASPQASSRSRRPAASRLTSEAFDCQLDAQSDWHDGGSRGGRWSTGGSGRERITFSNELPAQTPAQLSAAAARSISEDGGGSRGGGSSFSFANALPAQPRRDTTGPSLQRHSQQERESGGGAGHGCGNSNGESGSGVPGFDEQLDAWLSGASSSSLHGFNTLPPSQGAGGIPGAGVQRDTAGCEGEGLAGLLGGEGLSQGNISHSDEGEQSSAEDGVGNGGKGAGGGARSGSACSAVQQFRRAVRAIEDEHGYL